jgi:hypothetical protein
MCQNAPKIIRLDFLLHNCSAESPYCFSSFSFRTRKVLPGKSWPTFLYLTPKSDFRIIQLIQQRPLPVCVPDVLNRTLRGHSIVSRSQRESLLSAVPSQTGLNLNKCLVQDLLLHPIRNQAGTTANRQKSLFLLERKPVTFSSWISFPY